MYTVSGGVATCGCGCISCGLYLSSARVVVHFPLRFEALPRGYVAKLNPAGSGPVFSTYLGGDSYDYGEASRSTPPATSISRAGPSPETSPLLPGPSDRPSPALTRSTSPLMNVFVTKLNATGFRLLDVSRQGSRCWVCVDAGGNAYAERARPSGHLLELSWRPRGAAQAMALDAAGNVYLAGYARKYLDTTPGLYPFGQGFGAANSGAAGLGPQRLHDDGTVSERKRPHVGPEAETIAPRGARKLSPVSALAEAPLRRPYPNTG